MTTRRVTATRAAAETASALNGWRTDQPSGRFTQSLGLLLDNSDSGTLTRLESLYRASTIDARQDALEDLLRYLGALR